MTSENQSFSPEDRMNDLLEFLKDFQHQKRFVLLGTKPHFSMSPFEHIYYASHAFLTGAIPNANTLYFITNAFQKYITSEGKISLDEAFGLKSTPSQGNPAQKYAHDNFLDFILFDMAYLRAQNKMTNKRMSLEAVANSAAPAECPYEMGTLVDYYKKRKWDLVREIMIKKGSIKEGKLIF